MHKGGSEEYLLLLSSVLLCAQLFKEQGERLGSLIRKIPHLSIGSNGMPTQPLELTAICASALSKGKNSAPSLETDSCCKIILS